MPTYEYYCTSCRFEFEEFQSIASEPIQVCPKCKVKAVKRKISGGTGLIFKGSGFYITDYKKNKSEISTPKEPKKTDKKDDSKTKAS
jgi:putative FmdB family regulatory protein